MTLPLPSKRFAPLLAALMLGAAPLALAPAALAAPTETVQLNEAAQQVPEAAALAEALERYREKAESGGFTEIGNGPALSEGDSGERVAQLRTRLSEEMYLEEDNGEDAFDEGLAEALTAFQDNHALEPTGELNGATLTALNRSAEDKIALMENAIERWNALGDPGETFIWVNVPSFMAYGIHDGEEEIAMKTIVGRPGSDDVRTPMMSEVLEYAVANPRWTAPMGVVERHVSKELAQDPEGYAEKKGYTVIERATGETVPASDVDWTAEGVEKRYMLVQAPGSENAMGDLKIMFPNQYSINLHGSEDEALFDRANRAFSAGCVRLEEPVEFTKWIASHDYASTPASVERKMDTNETTRIELEEGIPIHFTYMLATTGEDGRVRFHADLYDEVDLDVVPDEPAGEAVTATGSSDEAAESGSGSDDDNDNDSDMESDEDGMAADDDTDDTSEDGDSDSESGEED